MTNLDMQIAEVVYGWKRLEGEAALAWHNKQPHPPDPRHVHMRRIWVDGDNPKDLKLCEECGPTCWSDDIAKAMELVERFNLTLRFSGGKWEAGQYSWDYRYSDNHFTVDPCIGICYGVTAAKAICRAAISCFNPIAPPICEALPWLIVSCTCGTRYPRSSAPCPDCGVYPVPPKGNA